jgi:hypothetical protein
MEFAQTLNEHPEWVKKTEPSTVNDVPPDAPDTPVALSTTGPGIRDVKSARKSPPTHPHAMSNEDVKVHLKSSPDPLVFDSRMDWERWIHDGLDHDGVGFIEQIAVDRDFPGFLATVNFIHQSERNPTILHEVNRRVVEAASRVLFDPHSGHQDAAVAILESILRQNQDDPASKDIEKLLMDYRAR